MTDLQKEWQAHRASAFPLAAKGQEVSGIDLVLVDTCAAGCIQTFVDTSALDDERAQALAGCVEELERAVPSLLGDTAEYFARLLDLSRDVLAKCQRRRWTL